MKPRSLLAGLIVTVVTVGFSLAIMEGATRVIYPHLVPSGHLRFEAPRGDRPPLGPRDTTVRQIKNTGDFNVEIAFNGDGLRDVKPLSEATPDALFVVGDSLAFGWGVEAGDRFSNLLQAELKRPVFNISSPTNLSGFSRLIDYAESRGARVGNLFLVLPITTTLQDYEAAARRQAANGDGGHGFLQRTKQFLMTHSALYFLVTSIVHGNPALRAWAIEAGLINPNLEGIRFKPYSRAAIDSTTRLAVDLARDRRTVVVLAPARGIWTGNAEQRDESRRLHKDFADSLRRAGLAVIDTLPVLERADSPLQSYYFPNDGHWNAAGHAAVARAMADFVSRQRPFAPSNR